jgi:hypothetical protein
MGGGFAFAEPLGGGKKKAQGTVGRLDFADVIVGVHARGKVDAPAFDALG